MQGTIPLPITPQSLVWLEGLYCFLVPILHCSTCRIVGIAAISRPEHRVAQTREVVCTKIVLPQVIARGLHRVCYMYFINVICLICIRRFNITEVAHDYQSAIKRYVEELGMVNSYETWHGMA